MPDDQHPADGIAQTIQGMFNGDVFKQAIRDAFDRITGQKAKPAPAPDPYMLHNDPDVAAANASFRQKALSDAAAAKIRAKASIKSGANGR